MMTDDAAGADALFRQAQSLHQQSRLDEAQSLYQQALRHEPRYFPALHLLGVIALQKNQAELAAELIGKALYIEPSSVAAYVNYGAAQHELRRFGDAVASFDRAIALKPDCAEAFYNRGNALRELKENAAAADSYDRAIALKADYLEAYLNRGLALSQLNEHAAALASYERAISIRPDYADLHYNRGNELRSLGRHEQAIASYERAVSLKPGHADAFINLGGTQVELRRYSAALSSYDQAIALRPDYAEAHFDRGGALQHLGRYSAAIASYEAAIQLRPDYAEAHAGRARALRELGRYESAVESYDRAIALQSEASAHRGTRRHTKMQICDWRDLEADLERISGDIDNGTAAPNPFYILTLADSAALQRRAAELWVRTQGPLLPSLPEIAKRERAERIHVGYFSADFHEHATAYLIAQLFELHDRSRFKITAFSFGPDSQGEMRGRLRAGCDAFIDVRDRSDAEVAMLARAKHVDIAVDLKGFTQGHRAGIFAERAAPLQVSYLGYPGTMGAPYMDYLVADPMLIPVEHRCHYSEKILYLPDSYQVNDTRRAISARSFTRTELGLPETGFVFCCFNNSYKILPGVFARWMRILARVPGSVLWLLGDNPAAIRNLRQAAAARHIDPLRLVFADRIDLKDHLARHRAADLCIDTLPCNAHTTASDALWAGLPVLTCAGEAFGARVAASLLTAIGLPELIASSPEHYEDLAVHLAAHPRQLAETRQRLGEQRGTAPLFDTPLFARNLEAAYTAIYERLQANLAPEHLDVRRDTTGAAAEHGEAAAIEGLMRRGIARHREGRLEEARGFYEQTLQRQPRHFEACRLLGVIAFQTNQHPHALQLFEQALSIDPQSALTHNYRGNALLSLGDRNAAIGSYDRAIGLKPDYTDAYHNRGNALFDLGRLDAAVESFSNAIERRADYALAYTNRGLALFCLKRYDAAVADYDKAIAIEPNNAEAHNNRADALRTLGDLRAAMAGYEAAIAAKPDHALAYNGRGITLTALRQYEAALDSYAQAVAIKPDLAEAYLNCGSVLRELGQWQGALSQYDRAIAINADLADAYYARAMTRRSLSDHEAAIADLDRAIVLQPDLPFLRGFRRHVKMELCDWDGFAEDLEHLTLRLERGEAVCPPFPLLALTGSAGLQRRAAEIWARGVCPADPSLSVTVKRDRHEKIRIGYFSADFRIHPVSYLMAPLFAMHDRSRFEITAFSFGPDSQDEMRRQLEGAFDRFIDVRTRSDRDVALLAREMQLDIAVDLGGYTENARPGTFALRAAPVQIGYLGYLGTTAIPHMDYLIADPTLVPPEYRGHYAEKILYLPSFLAHDCEPAEQSFSREELMLPPAAFVFCCFNTNYKITPDTFACWMRILDQAPDSVMFLYAGSAVSERNLRKEAALRGIDPARLVFAGRLRLAEHLARYRAADLFLDTLPYNAGITASDALRAGLPVLTYAGEAFASRMAASLLTTIGMPELITSTREEYEALAVALARDPGRLAELRRRLADQRLRSPLFDVRRFVKQLESGYTRVYEHYLEDRLPEDMAGASD